MKKSESKVNFREREREDLIFLFWWGLDLREGFGVEEESSRAKKNGNEGENPQPN